MRMGGASGATTFVDDVAGMSWTSGDTDIKIDTSQSVYEGSSLYCGGVSTGALYIQGSSAQLTANPIGTRPFTVQFRFMVHPSYVQAYPNRALFGSLSVGAANEFIVGHFHTVGGVNPSGNGTLYVANASGGVSYFIPSDSVFYHLEIGRIGTTCYVFINGNSIGTFAVPADMGNPFPDIKLGSINSVSNYHQFYGWLDEFNFIIDECLHTANFTPPTSAITYP